MFVGPNFKKPAKKVSNKSTSAAPARTAARSSEQGTAERAAQEVLAKSGLALQDLINQLRSMLQRDQPFDKSEVQSDPAARTASDVPDPEQENCAALLHQLLMLQAKEQQRQSESPLQPPERLQLKIAASPNKGDPLALSLQLTSQPSNRRATGGSRHRRRKLSPNAAPFQMQRSSLDSSADNRTRQGGGVKVLSLGGMMSQLGLSMPPLPVPPVISPAFADFDNYYQGYDGVYYGGFSGGLVPYGYGYPARWGQQGVDSKQEQSENQFSQESDYHQPLNQQNDSQEIEETSNGIQTASGTHDESDENTEAQFASEDDPELRTSDGQSSEHSDTTSEQQNSMVCYSMSPVVSSPMPPDMCQPYAPGMAMGWMPMAVPSGHPSAVDEADGMETLQTVLVPVLLSPSMSALDNGLSLSIEAQAKPDRSAPLGSPGSTHDASMEQAFGVPYFPSPTYGPTYVDPTMFLPPSPSQQTFPFASANANHPDGDADVLDMDPSYPSMISAASLASSMSPLGYYSSPRIMPSPAMSMPAQQMFGRSEFSFAQPFMPQSPVLSDGKMQRWSDPPVNSGSPLRSKPRPRGARIAPASRFVDVRDLPAMERARSNDIVGGRNHNGYKDSSAIETSSPLSWKLKPRNQTNGTRQNVRSSFNIDSNDREQWPELASLILDSEKQANSPTRLKKGTSPAVGVKPEAEVNQGARVSRSIARLPCQICMQPVAVALLEDHQRHCQAAD